MRSFSIGSVLLLVGMTWAADELPSRDLPKVVLLGDSIRLSYSSTVQEILDEKAIVISPKANGQDSGNLLRNLKQWAIDPQPQIIHFNCGIHDSKKSKADGTFQVSLAQYEQNLREIVRQIREQTEASLIFSTSTPIVDQRAAKIRSERDYELLDESIRQFNGIALRVMRELEVPVNDLNRLLTDNEIGNQIGSDGVHLTETGKELAGIRVSAAICQQLSADGRLEGPWKTNQWKEVPEFQWLQRETPIRSLLYQNEIFAGQTTDVFAFYATPGSVRNDPSLDKDLPAVVLIHGGGGTAFAEWAWLWANRGYAAIAMDLSGQRPAAPIWDPQTGELLPNPRASRTRLPRGGPNADSIAKFQNSGGDLSDDWQPHAVAAVMRAHSLIQSFPEVNADRTAVTGISWGGYMTCLVASLDDRFKAAVPVYGCGFLYEGESVQKPLIDSLPPEQRGRWICQYDPSMWLPQCRVPILFVNGTNDKHYPLNSYMHSSDLVPGPKQFRIEVAMRHGHAPGWSPTEIGWFIDQHVSGGTPLPKLSGITTVGGVAQTSMQSITDLESASLHYSTDEGPLVDRSWKTVPAEINGPIITANVPAAASIWMLSVKDLRGAMVSTGVEFAVAPK